MTTRLPSAGDCASRTLAGRCCSRQARYVVDGAVDFLCRQHAKQTAWRLGRDHVTSLLTGGRVDVDDPTVRRRRPPVPVDDAAGIVAALDRAATRADLTRCRAAILASNRTVLCGPRGLPGPVHVALTRAKARIVKGST